VALAHISGSFRAADKRVGSKTKPASNHQAVKALIVRKESTVSKTRAMIGIAVKRLQEA